MDEFLDEKLAAANDVGRGFVAYVNAHVPQRGLRLDVALAGAKVQSPLSFQSVTGM